MKIRKVAYLALLAAFNLYACTDDSTVKSSGDVEEPGDPTGGDPTGGDPTGGDPTGGDPTGGDPTGGDPVDEPDPDPVCGNGVLEKGEFCDDNNDHDEDGCSASCQVERGFACPNVGQDCYEVPEEVLCGDGITDTTAGEECDDRNTRNEDGCNDACKIEDGYRCKISRAGRSTCAVKACGDGFVDAELGEKCDEGARNVVASSAYGDGVCVSVECVWAPRCGDKTVDADFGETCDLGEDEAGHSLNTGEYGGCTSTCQLAPRCGDGEVFEGKETCDDGNTTEGDGCSSTCMREEGWICPITGGECVRMVCGNGEINGNERCDDGNFVSGDGCYNCQVEAGYKCDWDGKCTECQTAGVYCMPVEYGNGVLDRDGYEECDDHNLTNGDGCSADGRVEPGWLCPTEGERCRAKSCGDKILAYGEECDDGNVKDNDGCSYRCQIEPGWLCPEVGKECKKGFCGDGIVQKGEQCDNDVVPYGTKPASGDGCSSECQIEAGNECRTKGGECQSTRCGDGSIVASKDFTTYEKCDLGEDAAGNSFNDGTAGCLTDCTIKTGWHCDGTGTACAPGTCGDGKLDVGEDCDDGNTLPADGCSPVCTIESGVECLDGICKPICGDGITMWMIDSEYAEACDDGNLISGDGCSSECKKEDGFECPEHSLKNPPKFISLPVTYRDFRSTGRDSVSNAGSTDGFITQALIDAYPGVWNASRIGDTIHDFDSQGGCSCQGYVESELDTDGKPVLIEKSRNTCWQSNSKCFSSVAEYGMWYRDVEGLNKTVKSKLYMWLTNADKRDYYFTSDAPTTNDALNACVDGQPLETGYFLPLATTGYGYTKGSDGAEFARRHANYSFTSEVRTYFQYKGGESLSFSGDDDLWVFLNGHLFVDLGGLHGREDKTGKLAENDTEITVKNADGSEKKVKYNPKYDVYEGGIYELTLFHAERNATGSNFSLTLTGFLDSGTSKCEPICGDGEVLGNEQCDLGNGLKDGAEAVFLGCVNCQTKANCGNGIVEPGEACDTGSICKDVSNAYCDKYHVSYIPDPACNETTCLYDSCNNGNLEDYEECDCMDGHCIYKNLSDEGKKCYNTCRVSRCGDGKVDLEAGETCDDGNDNENDACTTKCAEPTCGDGVVSEALGEVCDDGINDGAYNHCGLGCRYLAPRCGDGKVQKNEGEQCDLGKAFNVGGYNGCSETCQFSERCGDGVVQEEEGEQCDFGSDNDTAIQHDGYRCDAVCQKYIVVY